MREEFHGHAEHHDGSSDATPGGHAGKRRPGELVFAICLLVGSLFLLREAYGISAFEALSAPGSVPMAVTAIMAVTALVIVLKTARLPLVTSESIARDILPVRVIVFIGLLVAYGILLKPVGFLPVTAVFLVIAIRFLDKRGLVFAVATGLLSLILIWMVFRLVFSVLMPPGIFPEAEMVQFFRNLLAGAR